MALCNLPPWVLWHSSTKTTHSLENKTFFLNPCLIDADSFLAKDINLKLFKKLDFRSYFMILNFILFSNSFS
ncbi:hypothetical protein EWZ97_02780 [Helicobacter pylori]|nr:hypothetical protein [Helicobacter pylori]